MDLMVACRYSETLEGGLTEVPAVVGWVDPAYQKGCWKSPVAFHPVEALEVLDQSKPHWVPPYSLEWGSSISRVLDCLLLIESGSQPSCRDCRPAPSELSRSVSHRGIPSRVVGQVWNQNQHRFPPNW